MKNVRSITALVAVVSMLLFCSGCGPTPAMKRMKQTQRLNATLRFREVETLMFRYTYDDEGQHATIYEDTKTNVRYLYVWGGMANGGPAITRLWDE